VNDDVQRQLDEMKRLIAVLAEEMGRQAKIQAEELRRLRAQVHRYETEVQSSALVPAGANLTKSTGPNSTESKAKKGRPISRRDFARWGGLAAAGAAASAAVIMGAEASPAAATTTQGGDVNLGEDNTGATARTYSHRMIHTVTLDSPERRFESLKESWRI
jgi:hypothetical protein